MRWYAGKLNPKVYGDGLEHSGQIDINIGLAGRLERARQGALAAATGAAVIEGVAESAIIEQSALSSAATDEPALGQ